MTVPSVKKIISGSLCLVYFTTQIALGSQPEISIWSERKKAQSAQYAALSPSAPISQRFSAIGASLPSIPTLKPSLEPRFEKLPAAIKPVIEALSLTPSTIQEVFPNSTSDKTQLKTPIVIVQDIHMNSEAQANIAATLQTLIDEKLAARIGVEGAFGEMDFSAFRKFVDKPAVRQIAESYLNQNVMAAPTFTGITNAEKTLDWFGVDDREHYDANVQAYLDSRSIKKSALKEIARAETELVEQKKKVFSPSLQRFDEIQAAYHAEQIGLGTYLSKLAEIKEPSPLSTVARFLEAFQMERTLDLPRIEVERNRTLKKLAATLSENETSDLLAQSVAYRSGRLTFGRYYGNLRNLCEKKGINLRETPVFENYLRYVLLTDSIKADTLFDEIDALETALKKEIAKTGSEQQLLAESEHVALTKKLVEFSLTAKEWENYKKVLRASYSVRRTTNSINEYQRRGTKDTARSTFLKPFESFYEQADLRTERMLANLLKENPFPPAPSIGREAMGEAHPVKGLVVGGFHTPLFTQRLREKKIPYVVVSPKITKIDNASGSAYLTVFAREKTPIEKLVQGEKLFVAPEDQNSVATHIRTFGSLSARLLGVDTFPWRIGQRRLTFRINILDKTDPTRDDITAKFTFKEKLLLFREHVLTITKLFPGTFWTKTIGAILVPQQLYDTVKRTESETQNTTENPTAAKPLFSWAQRPLAGAPFWEWIFQLPLAVHVAAGPNTMTMGAIAIAANIVFGLVHRKATVGQKIFLMAVIGSLLSLPLALPSLMADLSETQKNLTAIGGLFVGIGIHMGYNRLVLGLRQSNSGLAKRLGDWLPLASASADESPVPAQTNTSAANAVLARNVLVTDASTAAAVNEIKEASKKIAIDNQEIQKALKALGDLSNHLDAQIAAANGRKFGAGKTMLDNLLEQTLNPANAAPPSDAAADPVTDAIVLHGRNAATEIISEATLYLLESAQRAVAARHQIVRDHINSIPTLETLPKATYDSLDESDDKKLSDWRIRLDEWEAKLDEFWTNYEKLRSSTVVLEFHIKKDELKRHLSKPRADRVDALLRELHSGTLKDKPGDKSYLDGFRLDIEEINAAYRTLFSFHKAIADRQTILVEKYRKLAENEQTHMQDEENTDRKAHHLREKDRYDRKRKQLLQSVLRYKGELMESVGKLRQQVETEAARITRTTEIINKMSDTEIATVLAQSRADRYRVELEQQRRANESILNQILDEAAQKSSGRSLLEEIIAKTTFPPASINDTWARETFFHGKFRGTVRGKIYYALYTIFGAAGVELRYFLPIASSRMGTLGLVGMVLSLSLIPLGIVPSDNGFDVIAVKIAAAFFAIPWIRNRAKEFTAAHPLRAPPPFVGLVLAGITILPSFYSGIDSPHALWGYLANYTGHALYNAFALFFGWPTASAADDKTIIDNEAFMKLLREKYAPTKNPTLSFEDASQLLRIFRSYTIAGGFKLQVSMAHFAAAPPTATDTLPIISSYALQIDQTAEERTLLDLNLQVPQIPIPLPLNRYGERMDEPGKQLWLAHGSLTKTSDHFIYQPMDDRTWSPKKLFFSRLFTLLAEKGYRALLIPNLREISARHLLELSGQGFTGQGIHNDSQFVYVDLTRYIDRNEAKVETAAESPETVARKLLTDAPEELLSELRNPEVEDYFGLLVLQGALPANVDARIRLYNAAKRYLKPGDITTKVLATLDTVSLGSRFPFAHELTPFFATWRKVSEPLANERAELEKAAILTADDFLVWMDLAGFTELGSSPEALLAMKETKRPNGSPTASAFEAIRQLLEIEHVRALAGQGIISARMTDANMAEFLSEELFVRFGLDPAHTSVIRVENEQKETTELYLVSPIQRSVGTMDAPVNANFAVVHAHLRFGGFERDFPDALIDVAEKVTHPFSYDATGLTIAICYLDTSDDKKNVGKTVKESFGLEADPYATPRSLVIIKSSEDTARLVGRAQKLKKPKSIRAILNAVGLLNDISSPLEPGKEELAKLLLQRFSTSIDFSAAAHLQSKFETLAAIVSALNNDPEAERTVVDAVNHLLETQATQLRELPMESIFKWIAATANMSKDSRKKNDAALDNVAPRVETINDYRAYLQPVMKNVSPNGKLIAVPLGKNVVVFELATGKIHSILKGHSFRVNAVAFSPNGDRIATGSQDGTARVFSTSDGNVTAILDANGGETYAVAFSTDGEYVITGNGVGTARIFRISGGPAIAVLRGQSERVTAVAFDSENKIAVSVASNCTIIVFDTSESQIISVRNTDPPRPIRDIALSPDGKTLAAVGPYNDVHLFDLRSEQYRRIPTTHSADLFAVNFTANGEQIVTSSLDGTIRILDAHQGQQLRMLRGHSQTFEHVSYSPDGRFGLLADRINPAPIFDPSGNATIELTGNFGSFGAGVFSLDGKKVAVVGRDDGTLRILNVSNGKEIWAFKNQWPLHAVAFSRNGKMIAIGGSESGTVRVFDTDTGEILNVLNGPMGTISAIAFSPDSERVLAASWDQTAYIMHRHGREKDLRLTEDKFWISAAAFSPDGQYVIASGADDTAVRLFNATDGHLIAKMEGHLAGVRGAAFSPDGKLILTQSADETTRIWDAESHQLLRILPSIAFPIAKIKHFNVARILEETADDPRQPLERNAILYNPTLVSPASINDAWARGKFLNGTLAGKIYYVLHTIFGAAGVELTYFLPTASSRIAMIGLIGMLLSLSLVPIGMVPSDNTVHVVAPKLAAALFALPWIREKARAFTNAHGMRAPPAFVGYVLTLLTILPSFYFGIDSPHSLWVGYLANTIAHAFYNAFALTFGWRVASIPENTGDRADLLKMIATRKKDWLEFAKQDPQVKLAEPFIMERLDHARRVIEQAPTVDPVFKPIVDRFIEQILAPVLALPINQLHHLLGSYFWKKANQFLNVMQRAETQIFNRQTKIYQLNLIVANALKGKQNWGPAGFFYLPFNEPLLQVEYGPDTSQRDIDKIKKAGEILKMLMEQPDPLHERTYIKESLTAITNILVDPDLPSHGETNRSGVIKINPASLTALQIASTLVHEGRHNLSTVIRKMSDIGMHHGEKEIPFDPWFTDGKAPVARFLDEVDAYGYSQLLESEFWNARGFNPETDSKEIAYMAEQLLIASMAISILMAEERAKKLDTTARHWLVNLLFLWNRIAEESLPRIKEALTYGTANNNFTDVELRDLQNAKATLRDIAHTWLIDATQLAIKSGWEGPEEDDFSSTGGLLTTLRPLGQWATAPFFQFFTGEKMTTTDYNRWAAPAFENILVGIAVFVMTAQFGYDFNTANIFAWSVFALLHPFERAVILAFHKFFGTKFHAPPAYNSMAALIVAISGILFGSTIFSFVQQTNIAVFLTVLSSAAPHFLVNRKDPLRDQQLKNIETALLERLINTTFAPQLLDQIANQSIEHRRIPTDIRENWINPIVGNTDLSKKEMLMLLNNVRTKLNENVETPVVALLKDANHHVEFKEAFIGPVIIYLDNNQSARSIDASNKYEFVPIENDQIKLTRHVTGERIVQIEDGQASEFFDEPISAGAHPRESTFGLGEKFYFANQRSIMVTKEKGFFIATIVDEQSADGTMVRLNRPRVPDNVRLAHRAVAGKPVRLLTTRYSQWLHMKFSGKQFKTNGKTVVMNGPLSQNDISSSLTSHDALAVNADGIIYFAAAANILTVPPHIAAAARIEKKTRRRINNDGEMVASTKVKLFIRIDPDKGFSFQYEESEFVLHHKENTYLVQMQADGSCYVALIRPGKSAVLANMHSGQVLFAGESLELDSSVTLMLNPRGSNSVTPDMRPLFVVSNIPSVDPNAESVTPAPVEIEFNASPYPILYSAVERAKKNNSSGTGGLLFTLRGGVLWLFPSLGPTTYNRMVAPFLENAFVFLVVCAFVNLGMDFKTANRFAWSLFAALHAAEYFLIPWINRRYGKQFSEPRFTNSVFATLIAVFAIYSSTLVIPGDAKTYRYFGFNTMLSHYFANNLLHADESARQRPKYAQADAELLAHLVSAISKKDRAAALRLLAPHVEQYGLNEVLNRWEKNAEKRTFRSELRQQLPNMSPESADLYAPALTAVIIEAFGLVTPAPATTKATEYIFQGTENAQSIAAGMLITGLTKPTVWLIKDNAHTKEHYEKIKNALALLGARIEIKTYKEEKEAGIKFNIFDPESVHDQQLPSGVTSAKDVRFVLSGDMHVHVPNADILELKNLIPRVEDIERTVRLVLQSA